MQGGKQWNASVMATHNTSFKIKVVNSGVHGSIMVGFILSSSFHSSGNIFTSEYGYFMYLHDGFLYGNNQNRSYGMPVLAGSIVEVKLDKEKRTISFGVDGKNLGVAFRNCSFVNELFPAVDLRDPLTSVALLS
eukprot:TRINITY_DN6370_c0_g1_i1.p1 TRINITY_DN6370_c0_g1~~TRINITY_DN6370_c0_g1_i1.p1  ORF type:complete len:134 (-),score=13.83 TRINITY_DN6370_c0_g1_i1:541-942(-)